MRHSVKIVASRTVVLSVIVGGLLLIPSTAAAAICTWTGLGGNNDWTTGANWAAGCGPKGPVHNDSVVFPAGANRPFPANDNFFLSLDSVTISGLAAGNERYVLSGNGFSIQNALTMSAPPAGGNGPMITATLALSGNATFTYSNVGIARLPSIGLNGFQLTFDVTNNNGEIFVEGNILQNGLVRKTGTGQVVMFGNNTYTGNTQVLGGRIGVATNSGLGASGPGNGTVVSAGAHVYFFSQGVTLVPESMTLSGSGSGVGALYILNPTIEASGDIVLVGLTEIGVLINTGHLILSGNIIGNGTLNKAGDGKLTLRGNNSYAETLFEAGSLFINGNQPTVGTDMLTTATLLGGTGVMGGTGVKGGRVAPGLSPGILGTASFTLNQIATYDIELAGPTPGAGYDQLNVTGLVSLAGSLTGTVTFAPAPGATFTIINNDGGDAVAGTFTGLPEGASFQLSGQPFRITYAGGTGNDVVLTYNPLIIVPTMPWPMLVFLALALAGLVFMRLRGTPQRSLRV